MGYGTGRDACHGECLAEAKGLERAMRTGRGDIFEGRPKRTEESGGSRLNLILALLFLGGTIFVAVKIIPPYFNNYQFQDAVESEARFALAGYPRKSEDDVREDVFKKAQDLAIPVQKKEEILVTMNQGNVTISLDYSIPIDLLGYQFTLQFHPHADNHSI